MTLSISLDKFYDNIDKHVKLVSSFTDKKGLSKVITMCRLKPYDIIFNEYNEKIILHEHWVDEYRNSLWIRKDKKIDIKLNDLNINKEKISKTDLYEQLSIDKVSMISKFAFFLSGKDEDLHEEHVVLSLLGIDGFLRTFVYIYGEWHRYPSLCLGIKPLLAIAENLDLIFYKKINIKQAIYPCDDQQAFLLYWPPSKDFVSIMNQQNESVVALLQLKKENNETHA